MHFSVKSTDVCELFIFHYIKTIFIVFVLAT